MAEHLASRAAQPAPVFVTRSRNFETVGAANVPLLAVRAGVDSVDALQHAQVLLDMALVSAVSKCWPGSRFTCWNKPSPFSALHWKTWK